MRAILAFGTYAVAGSLTFGVAFNHNYVDRGDCGNRPRISDARYETWERCRFPPHITTAEGAGMIAAAAGVFWPAYWAGRLSIQVTKP